MADNDIDFRSENNSNLELGDRFLWWILRLSKICEIRFQEIKQQKAEITYDKTTGNTLDIKRWWKVFEHQIM